MFLIWFLPSAVLFGDGILDELLSKRELFVKEEFLAIVVLFLRPPVCKV